jgi:hypothetical protein
LSIDRQPVKSTGNHGWTICFLNGWNIVDWFHIWRKAFNGFAPIFDELILMMIKIKGASS